MATLWARPTKADAQQVLATLEDVATLEAAAAQFASALGIEPDKVRARVITDECPLCDMKSGAPYSSLAGVSVAEAEAVLQDGGRLWLFKGSSSCQYQHEDGVYRPLKCH